MGAAYNVYCTYSQPNKYAKKELPKLSAMPLRINDNKVTAIAVLDDALLNEAIASNNNPPVEYGTSQTVRSSMRQNLFNK